jgi:hypothetical protein
MKKHRRIYTCLFAAFAVTLLQTTSIAQIASDNAADPAYADGWSEGDDGGTGFEPWTGGMYAFPFEIDVDDPEPDNNLGAPAFRYGNGAGGGYWAIRPFTDPLQEGQSFKMDFDSFFYPAEPPSPENPVPAESQSLIRFGVGSAGPGERFSFYNYYYNDGTTVFGGDLKWGLGADSAFDNLNGGVSLEAGISGWLANYTVPESTDGFSLMLDVLANDMYRFRVVDDDVTVIDVSGNLKGDATVGAIDSLTLWSVGGDTSNEAVPTSYFNNLQIIETPSDALPGDFNENGKVDAADYVVWRKTIGAADAYNLWRTNFDRTAGSGAVSSAQSLAAVPEPAAATIVAAGMMAFIMRRARRSGSGLSE